MKSKLLGTIFQTKNFQRSLSFQLFNYKYFSIFSECILESCKWGHGTCITPEACTGKGFNGRYRIIFGGCDTKRDGFICCINFWWFVFLLGKNGKNTTFERFIFILFWAVLVLECSNRFNFHALLDVCTDARLVFVQSNYLIQVIPFNHIIYG